MRRIEIGIGIAIGIPTSIKNPNLIPISGMMYPDLSGYLADAVR